MVKGSKLGTISAVILSVFKEQSMQATSGSFRGNWLGHGRKRLPSTRG